MLAASCKDRFYRPFAANQATLWNLQRFTVAGLHLRYPRTFGGAAAGYASGSLFDSSVGRRWMEFFVRAVVVVAAHRWRRAWCCFACSRARQKPLQLEEIHAWICEPGNPDAVGRLPFVEFVKEQGFEFADPHNPSMFSKQVLLKHREAVRERARRGMYHPSTVHPVAGSHLLKSGEAMLPLTKVSGVEATEVHPNIAECVASPFLLGPTRGYRHQCCGELCASSARGR